LYSELRVDGGAIRHPKLLGAIVSTLVAAGRGGGGGRGPAKPRGQLGGRRCGVIGIALILGAPVLVIVQVAFVLVILVLIETQPQRRPAFAASVHTVVPQQQANAQTQLNRGGNNVPAQCHASRLERKRAAASIITKGEERYQAHRKKKKKKKTEQRMTKQ
jgi:hypothetical protein